MKPIRMTPECPFCDTDEHSIWHCQRAQKSRQRFLRAGPQAVALFYRGRATIGQWDEFLAACHQGELMGPKAAAASRHRETIDAIKQADDVAECAVLQGQLARLAADALHSTMAANKYSAIQAARFWG